MLLSADFESFIDYFKEWAENDPDIKFFLYGGVELGIDYATGNSSFEYPFAWLEQPEIESEDNGAGQLMEKYVFGISVITKADMSDLEAQNQGSIETIRILYRLQRKLLADNKKKNRRPTDIGFVELDTNMRKTEVDRGWAGNHRGWRLEIILKLNANTILL